MALDVRMTAKIPPEASLALSFIALYFPFSLVVRMEGGARKEFTSLPV